jgi:hypothetical protein
MNDSAGLVTTADTVVNATAALLGIPAIYLISGRRSPEVRQGRRVVRLVLMEMGYSAETIGQALGVGVASVYKWSADTTKQHMEMAREVSETVRNDL